MVSKINLLLLGGAVAAFVFFRNEISGAAGALGNVGKGIQGFISSVFSPNITPRFVPTVGLNFESRGFPSITNIPPSSQYPFGGIGIGEPSPNSNNSNSSPSGQQGGINLEQGTCESSPVCTQLASRYNLLNAQLLTSQKSLSGLYSSGVRGNDPRAIALANIINEQARVLQQIRMQGDVYSGFRNLLGV